MDLGLGIAGLISLALGLGHLGVGLRWVLPHLIDERLPATPFGPQSMTRSMIRVTWYIVTIFALGSGGILMTLAWAPDADPRVVTLRWFAVIWLAATVMALAVSFRGMRSLAGLVRLPVPLLWVVVAILCWIAAR